MKFKFLLIATFALTSAKSLSGEPEFSVLDDLVKGSQPVKRNAEADEQKQPVKTLQEEESKAPSIPKIALTDLNAPGQRVKKQSPVNQDCGKTSCGPMISAYGPGLDNLRAYMQGNPLPNKELVGNNLDEVDLTAPKMNPPMNFNRMTGPTNFDRMTGPTNFNRNAPPPEFSRMNPMTDFNRMATGPENQAPQGKTWELLGFNPLANGNTFGANQGGSTNQGYGNQGYGGNSGYGTNQGNSFWKPPAVVPQVPEIQHWVHPGLVHPGLFPHQGYGLNPHRFFAPFYPEGGYYDRQPPYNNGAEGMYCTFYNNRRGFENGAPQNSPNKPDDRIDDKQFNITDTAAKSADSADSTDQQIKSMEEYLRHITEIKEDIRGLFQKAQKYVDYQEKLAEMAHKHQAHEHRNGFSSGYNYGPSNMYTTGSTSYQRDDAYDRGIPPYYGGYFPGGFMGGGFMRNSNSNAASFPQSQADTEFFMNLMHNLKRLGLLSNNFQESIIAPVEQTKSVQQQQQQTKSQNRDTEDLITDLVDGIKQDKLENKPKSSSRADKNKKQRESSNEN